MKLQPIVEGHGDVSAVPVLLRRLIALGQLSGIEVDKPIRRKRHELTKEDSLNRVIQLALLRRDCVGIFIVFDADDDCPAEMAPELASWAAAAARGIPCVVVMARREYEAWFLGSIESLRGKRGIRLDAAFPYAPESRRGAKEAIEDMMEVGASYSETADQPALTALFDFASAYRRCRSFRHMATAFASLVSRIGAPLASWPPSEWVAEGT